MLPSLSVEASIFMDDTVMSDERQSWVPGRAKDMSNPSSGLFQDLDEAAFEIRELEVQYTTITRLRLENASVHDPYLTIESEEEGDSHRSGTSMLYSKICKKDSRDGLLDWIQRKEPWRINEILMWNLSSSYILF
jgi:hypothetical protein